MKRKIIIIIICISILLIGITSIFVVNNKKCEDKAIDLINTHIQDISKFVNKYEVMNNGTLEINANYKGAHGESYPAKFTYNYELSDKLYFENDVYTYLDVNTDVLHFLNNIKSIENIDVYKYTKKRSHKNVTTYSYDVNHVNEILNTDFEKVEIKVFTKGIYKVIDYIEVSLDDNKITVNKKDIDITYKNNDIELVKNDAGYYLSINGKLKCNIFINNDNYSFSIVFNNTVYYLEIRDSGLVIKFTSPASIYNSIDIKVSYKDNKVTKKKISNNFDDNPIIRYLSKSDLSLWR